MAYTNWVAAAALIGAVALTSVGIAATPAAPRASAFCDIGLQDDVDGLFDDTSKSGYAALTGYADKGRYTIRGAAGQKWLDVVRGKVACEARFGLDDNGNPLNRDWKEVGGKICLAAFALH